jgi:adenylate cyclase class IV
VSANVEIKARLHDSARQIARLEALAGGASQRLRQIDTFYAIPAGRLKLRTLGPEAGELIVYRRADAPGPRRSDYAIYPTQAPEALARVLTAALGVSGVVRKERTLYRAGRTRLHLDRVEGLGEFLEIEVVLAPGEDEAAALAEARDWMQKLDVRESDLVAAAYVDLLARG